MLTSGSTITDEIQPRYLTESTVTPTDEGKKKDK